MISVKALLFLGLVQMSFCLPGGLEYLSEDGAARLTPYKIQQRDFIVDKIIELVEKLKAEMKVGVPEMGVPPLDPLYLGDYNLGPLDLGSAGIIDVADFSKINVYGLPEFNMTSIKMNILNLNLRLNLTFNHVRVDGKYSIDGKLLNLVPIFGGGPFHVEVSEVLIAGDAKLKARNGKLSIEKLKIYTEVGHVHIHFEELMGGGDFGDELNGILQSTGQVLLKKFAPNIGEFLGDFARLKLNDALQHVDFGNTVG